jgi:hypothetical protein
MLAPMSDRSPARLAAVLLAAVLTAACSGADRPGLTTPTGSTGRPGTGGTGGVRAERGAFEAGNNSGIVASKRHPGVFWAIRDRGATDKPGKPRNGLYAFRVEGGRVGEVVPGAALRAVPVPAANHDWEAMGRDDDGNLWIGDIGNNDCKRSDTAVLKVREPDPAARGPAQVLATYRYRFPDAPPGCGGRNAEAMFLVDDVPYLVDKTPESTVYRFPRLDPLATVTLERVGSLGGPRAGRVSRLSGADLSSDRRLFVVQTHGLLFVYRVADPALRGEAFVAALVRQVPDRTVALGCDGCARPNVEAVGFGYGGHDLTLVAENRDVYHLAAGDLDG